MSTTATAARTTLTQIASTQPAAKLLQRAADTDTFGHAYLLAGQPDAGQHDIAHAAADAINGQTAPDAVIELTPDGPTHTVSDVRDTWMDLATRTSRHHRILLIRDADRMTPQAQNALLKQLEEPRPGLTWMLCVPDASSMLDTIVSRCQLLTLKPADHQTLLAAAADSPTPQVAAAASLGQLHRARQLADDTEAGWRNQLVDATHQLLRDRHAAVADLTSTIEDYAKHRAAIHKQQAQTEYDRLDEMFDGSWPTGWKTRYRKKIKRASRDGRTRGLADALDLIVAYLRDVAHGTPTSCPDRNTDVQAAHTHLQTTPLLAAATTIHTTHQALARNGHVGLQLDAALHQAATNIRRT